MAVEEHLEVRARVRILKLWLKHVGRGPHTGIYRPVWLRRSMCARFLRGPQ